MRIERSDLLLRRQPNCEIVFSDEKLFVLQASHNSQNDRVYVNSMSDIPADKRTIERY